jgi:PilZ domain
MGKSSEKRKHPRVAAKNVGAHVNFADRSTPCQILNISAGGMLVESAEPLPAGIPVAVNLAQPGWTRVLRLPGRVVWALAPKAAAKKGKPPGMRIRFDPLALDTAEMLLELLHSLGIGETPPPERVANDTLDPLETLPPPGGRPRSRQDVPQARPPSRVDVPQAKPPSRVDVPAGAPQTRTIRGAAQVDGLRAPLGAPGTETLPGPRTQELSLGDIVAHISKVDVPVVKISSKKPTDDATALNLLPDEGSLLKLTSQVKGLKLQLDELQRALEDRERELTEARDTLAEKQLALEKADRERKAAETAIQRLSMQLAARR